MKQHRVVFVDPDDPAHWETTHGWQVAGCTRWYLVACLWAWFVTFVRPSAVAMVQTRVAAVERRLSPECERGAE